MNKVNALKYLRTHRGLTVSELSREAGVKIYDINRMESGIISIAIYKVCRIAQFFNVSVDALLRNNVREAMNSIRTTAVRAERISNFYEEKQALRRQIGEAGEQWAFEEECRRLYGTVLEYGVDPNYSQELDAHFDILTFDRDGNAVMVEVKTTTGDSQMAFFMSSSEVELARESMENGQPYEIHRVYHVLDEERCGQKVISAEELFTQYEFVPCNYMVKKKVVA